ncbi:sugar transporter [Albirhodobacter sp. R86504]|uniref:sugar transporter n=1 Tax=Albirhodobacter sp. R86504 TaxID=3093848 RepID=UPI003671EF86
MSTTPNSEAKGQSGTIGAKPATNLTESSPGRKPAAAAIPLLVSKSSMPARMERRHWMISKSFIAAVVLPLLVLVLWLWGTVEDQYASHLGFSVRSENAPQPFELLGGLAGLTSSSTSDLDILYKFLNSRDLVQRIDAQLGLQQIWGGEKGDPFFSYHGDHTIELLLRHWSRKVDVSSDSGMIDIRVLAFDPRDAQAITKAIFKESSTMINDLNAIARDDTISYSREGLERSVERMTVARQALAAFRDKHQLVDPSANVQGQLGVLASLQQQLAEALVDRGMLNVRDSADPRMQQNNLRVKVIEDQIEKERQKFGGQSKDGEVLSSVIGEYERLQVEHQFAEAAYTASLAAFDSAQSEAQRKSRYLAAYVKPTLAQTAEYPQRLNIFVISLFFLLMLWTVGVLIFYSIRNRR